LRDGPARDRYWHWGVDGVPERCRRVLDRFGELWVATDFACHATRRFTDTPTFRFTPAADVALERRWQRAEFSLPDDVFLFLHRFDSRFTAERSNPAAVIRAFRHAFPNGSERAGLVMKCCHVHARPEELGSLVALAQRDPRIVFIDRLLTDKPLLGLQSVCDAYISLHRAKALDLGIARSMALGKPVIATAYSGNLDFMTGENGCLVDYALIPVKPGEYFAYEPGLRWASADIDQAAGYMQRLVADDAWRQRIGEQARAHVTAHFDRRIAADAIRRRLLALSPHVPGGT
jgi:glycosyltransferase involved in cell wall biosynthesis